MTVPEANLDMQDDMLLIRHAYTVRSTRHPTWTWYSDKCCEFAFEPHMIISKSLV